MSGIEAYTLVMNIAFEDPNNLQKVVIFFGVIESKFFLLFWFHHMAIRPYAL